MLNTFQLVTIFLMIVWQLTWIYTEQKSKKEKPRTKPPTLSTRLKRATVYLFETIGLLQLLGVIRMWTFPANQLIALFGFVLFLVGFATSITARLALGANWAHAAEYQITKKQELVSKGVYKYIRHPIYTGYLLAILGIEILAQSFLFIPAIILFSWGAYKQAKREEQMLIKHFGSKYEDYMKQTKMFIPYIY